MMKKVLGLAVLALVSAGVVQADPFYLYCDFEDGLEPGLSFFKTEETEDIWNVDIHEGELRINKGYDDGTVNPTSSISAGIQSDFFLVGDFEITVEFSLVDFPFPGETSHDWYRLNESVLSVWPDDPPGVFAVLRGRAGQDTPQSRSDFYEVWNGAVQGKTDSNWTGGRYRIKRESNVITGLISSSDTGPFDIIYSGEGFTRPAQVHVYGSQLSQLQPTGGRSKTPMDIRFDNLEITADAIIPEPATLLLLGLGGLALLRKRMA